MLLLRSLPIDKGDTKYKIIKDRKCSHPSVRVVLNLIHSLEKFIFFLEKLLKSLSTFIFVSKIKKNAFYV